MAHLQITVADERPNIGVVLKTSRYVKACLLNNMHAYMKHRKCLEYGNPYFNFGLSRTSYTKDSTDQPACIKNR